MTQQTGGRNPSEPGSHGTQPQQSKNADTEPQLVGAVGVRTFSSAGPREPEKVAY
jgi:hypothetical protein